MNTELERTAGDLTVLVRPPREADQGYVASTWAEQMMRADKNARRSYVNHIINKLLDDSTVRVLVAVDPVSPDTIVGWLCYSVARPRLIHFAYTRSRVRRRGIQRALMFRAGLLNESRTLVYTLKGPSSGTLLERHPTAVHMPVSEFIT